MTRRAAATVFAALAVFAVPVLAAPLLAGCAASAGGAAGSGAVAGTHSPAPLPSPTRYPAAVAGGACQLLDYDVVAADLGTVFDIAAAGQVDETYTCVLQQQGASLPDLALSVTSVQDLDATTFKAKLQPKGATAVTGLGKLGYSLVRPAAGGTGPVVEVGWLSGNQRVILLKLRTVAGTSTDQAKELVPKVLVLARTIDVTSV